MQIDVITLFPDMFRAVTDYGVCGRAIQSGVVNVGLWNPRDFTQDTYGAVDDRPYGGGPGMVLQYEPLLATLTAIRQQGEAWEHAPVMYLSPQGRRLDHRGVMELAARPVMIMLAGRYEGVDQRWLDQHVDEHWSIGDYVLSGGELAAMVIIDAMTRQLPGTLGHEGSAGDDSFVNGLLDWPHYTRPETIGGETVPAVLLSGDHKAINRWRLKQALGTTWLHRPDLLLQRRLSDEEQALLQEFIQEHNQESEYKS